MTELTVAQCEAAQEAIADLEEAQRRVMRAQTHLRELDVETPKFATLFAFTDCYLAWLTRDLRHTFKTPVQSQADLRYYYLTQEEESP